MESNNNDKLYEFLHSYDFMRLGQAISHNQWQMAAMIVQRMTKQAKELGIDSFERNLTGLRQAINRKNVVDAKQNLSIIINKRVKLIENENKFKE